MKKILILLSILIFSCDNDNIDVASFNYPLSVGNLWSYSFNYEASFPAASVGEIVGDTLCSSSGIMTITILNKVELNNGIETYEMNYNLEQEQDSPNNCFQNSNRTYYVNNTSEGFIYYAMDEGYWTNESSGLPMNQNNINMQIIEQVINPINPIYSNLINRDCIYHIEPPAKGIEYPIELNNTWIGINNNETAIYEECDNESGYLADYTTNFNDLMDVVVDINTECFTVNEYGNLLPDLASDIYTENSKTYCMNIGLTNFEADINLGEQSYTDEFGNSVGSFHSYTQIEFELIEHVLY